MEIDDLIARLTDMAAGGEGLERLLEAAVEGLSKTDPRFDWTGIYELFSDDVLRLGPFVGAPTDHVFIGVGNGVCGTAVAERRNMNIPDVREITNYLACSVSTRSELVVLIRSGDVIYGQIDIDSHQVGAFSDSSVAKVERVADWLAGAYTRARGAA
ncbi:MAG TPA: GAF domain-containing protein [Candidatus Eisenbacteria bacterium]|nr:GAF domain-containing protein [Candidatus Eisenbacteria bacterium]